MVVTEKVKADAHKVVYLIKAYPEHTLTEVISLLQMPSIDINAAVWCAVNEGYIGEPDSKSGKVELLKSPDNFTFGKEIEDLASTIEFCFQQLAKKETDLEENYLSNWTQGYPAHDVLIALKQLEESDRLVQYTLLDGENPYTFFTLAANKDKEWGRKQFKEDPQPDEDKTLAEQIEAVDENEVENEDKDTQEAPAK